MRSVEVAVVNAQECKLRPPSVLGGFDLAAARAFREVKNDPARRAVKAGRTSNRGR
jgi:hypothetical protein